MKRLLMVAVCVSFLTVAAEAQIPRVQIYFDSDFRQTNAWCPGQPPGTVVETAYVVAENFDIWLSAIEYSIEYPMQVMFIADVIDPSLLHLGMSPDGIAIAFPTPGNAYQQLLVQKIIFLWMCDVCPLHTAYYWRVGAYPGELLPRAVSWPNEDFVDAQGGTSVICGGSPVETSTWGLIKAMYE